MSSFYIGVAGAILAATFYNAGIAVQALEARDAPQARALRASLLAGLATRRRWILGTLLVTLGWTLQAGALLFAPLTVVQPALAAGLLLLLVIGSRILHEPVGWRELAATIAICGGLAGLAIAAPRHTLTQATGLEIALALAIVGVAALLPYLLTRLGRPPGLSVVLSSGLAYAWCGMATKLLSDSLDAGAWVHAALWALATAAAAGVGLLSEMTSLQTRPTTRVAPVVLVVDISVAVAFGVLIVGERWDVTSIGAVGVLASVVLVTVGAAVLAASPVVAAATEGESAHASAPDG
jgi:drug/metabolite transporter (DMT)-like permease